jgi:transposase
LGLPLCTTTVSGERADDPLYVPEIRKVQASLAQHGVLYVGDSKMAAIETRTFIATSADHYLCPLPANQMPPAELQALLIPVWSGQQALTPVQRATATEPDKLEHIADGFTYTVTLKDQQTQWCETRLVVKSLKHAQAKQLALDKRLIQAQQEIKALNLRGRGRKRLDEAQTCAAVQAILQQRVVTGLLSVTYDVQTQTSHKRTRLDPTPKEVTKVDVTVQVVRDSAAYDDFVRTLGWRVFVCNDPELDLVEVVLAYREEYLIERGFNRLRGKPLGMTPLYLNSTERIKGLIRLLCIGLRVLCLVEYAVREALREKSEKLAGIYAGNPKRSTARPTTEMMLKAFEGITRVTVSHNGTNLDHVTPLNAVQTRILSLLGFPMSIYQRLAAQS